MQRVVIHNPEILERWLGPLAEQMKQRIEGADLQQLFDEAQSALQVVAAAVMQMPLEDPEDEATAINKSRRCGSAIDGGVGSLQRPGRMCRFNLA